MQTFPRITCCPEPSTEHYPYSSVEHSDSLQLITGRGFNWGHIVPFGEMKGGEFCAFFEDFFGLYGINY